MSEASSFNCTQCGAGLDALGGGRVRTHVCTYCGAQLDVQDNYRVLAQFRDMKRPNTPFDLGMAGSLWGQDFTIIGTIAWTERYNAETFEWVDHQIFSPTHGYGWLTFENGHVTHARKSRSTPDPARLSHSTIEHAESRPRVKFGGAWYSYYASGNARPTFIEGAFNYLPTMSDQKRYVSLLGATHMLDIVETGSEREYELMSLPDQAKLMESFGVAPERLPHPSGVHPLQLIDRSPLQLFARNLLLGAAAISLVLCAFFWIQGSRVAESSRQPVDAGVALPFTITQANRLTQIEIWADAQNSWAWFESELTDSSGEVIAGYEDGVAYYRGRSGGESWSEGSQRVRTKLALPPGDYTLDVRLADAQVDWAGGRKAKLISARVDQGLMNPLWMLSAFALFLALGGAFLVGRFIHNAQRMAGSDWSDE